jgi:nucleoside 2-deoxyribosyltransferase
MEINIVGGVYKEFCAWPEFENLMGSAGRAANCISTLSPTTEINLVTEVSEADSANLKKKFAFSKNVALNLSSRPFTPQFHYAHPLSAPIVFPKGKRYQHTPICHNFDTLIMFGMIDRTYEVEANMVIYDPQNTEYPYLFSETKSAAKELVYILNKHELNTFYSEAHGGSLSDLASMASWLRIREKAKLVVVKAGTDGAIVCSESQNVSIPCYKSNTVNPLGSGDCFVAAFTHFYLKLGRSYIEAADMASFATSFYVENGTLVHEEDLLQAYQVREQVSQTSEGKEVYLAGPFFSMPELWLINEAKGAIEGLGMLVHSPYHALGIGPAEVVAPEDLKALDRCDVVYALFDNHDPGTLFEIGYAISKNKKVIIYSETSNDEALKMYEGTGCIVERDFATSLYKLGWL